MALSTYFHLIRPFNCLMAAFGAYIGYAIALHAFAFSTPVLLALLAVFFVCAGGQAINDYFDKEIDAQLRPHKPIPSGKLSPREVIQYSIALFAIGNIFAYLVGILQFAIAIVFTFLLIGYSSILSRDHKYIGNWVVASGTAFTLVYGASLIPNYSIVVILALSALFANLAREITKDFEDLQADKGFKRSLPMVLPEKEVRIYVGIYYLLAIVFGFYAHWLFSLNSFYFILLVLASLLFVFAFYTLWKEQFEFSQQVSKAGMFLALLAFLASVF